MQRLALLLSALGFLSLGLATASPPAMTLDAVSSAIADTDSNTVVALEQTGPDCRPITIAKGERSAWGQSNATFAGAELIINSPQAWGSFWQRHVGSTAPVTPPPIDFQQQVVVAVIQGPQPSGGGPNIAITEFVPRDGFVIIRIFDDRRPGPATVITNPFHIVAIPRACLPLQSSLDFERAAPVAGTGVILGRVLGARPDAAAPPAPLAGANVKLIGASATSVRTAITGLDGSFFFLNVQPGAYQLGAGAPGYQPAAVLLTLAANARVGHEFVLQLAPPAPGSITGHTAQPEGTGLAPLPDTLLELLQQDVVLRQTTSGADGAYEFPQVPPGAYRIRASHEGFVTQAVEVVLASGQSLVKDFVLQPGPPVPGSVTGHTARPADGALAPLAGTLVELRKQDQTLQQTTSGEDGAYAFTEVAAGAYILRASHEGFLPLALPVVVGSGQAVIQDFVLQPRPPAQSGTCQGHVRGTSTDGDAVPLGQALVRLFKSGTTEIRQARTNLQGLFVILDVPPGHYMARAQKDGWQPATVELDIVAGQTTERNFLLQPIPPSATTTGE